MAVLVNKESGLAENLSDQTAQAAIASGTHDVPLYDPQGNAVTAAHADMGDLLNNGYSQPKTEELNAMLKTAKHSSTPEQIKTGLEGAAEAGTFGLSTGVETALGANPEDIRARRETNPGVHALGQVAGLGASMLTGVGEAAILERVGAAAVEKLAPVMAASFVGRVGSQAAKAAIENMMFQSGDEASKMFSGDPNQSMETAASDIGLSGLIGAGIGGGMSGVGELWKMGPGKKLDGLLGAMADRSGGLPSEVKNAAGIQIPAEVEAALGDNVKAREAFQVLQESNSSSGKQAQKLFQQFRADANDGLIAAIGKTPEEAMAASEYEIGKVAQKQLGSKIDEIVKPIAEKYEKIEEKFKNALIPEDVKAEAANKITQAINENNLLKGPSEASLKLANKVLEQLPTQTTAQDIRMYVRGLSDLAPYGSETYQIGKQLKTVLNDLQEQTITKSLSNNAPELLAEYQGNQAAYRSARELIDALNDRLHVGKFGGPGSFVKALKEMDPETVLKRLSPKGDVDMQKLISEQFPEVAETARQHELNKILKNAGGKNDEVIDAKKLFSNMDKLSPELRSWILKPEQAKQLEAIKELLDRVPKGAKSAPPVKTIDKLWNEVPAAAAGMASMAMGHSGPLAYIMTKIGTLVGKEAPDAVKLAMLKFLGSSEKVSSEGFKNAVHAASAVLKGESALNKSVASIFGPTTKVISEPSLKDRDKLKKQIDEVLIAPEKLLEMDSATGHYLPEHQIAKAEIAMRNLQYLASLRPKTDKLGVLDAERKPSKFEEAAYNQALNIAQQPLIVLKSVKEGSITQSELQHLQALYPALLMRMQSKVMQELTEKVSDGKTVPYKTRIGLSMFLGQPLDSSMQPQSIMSAQGLGNQQQQQAVPQQGKVTQSGLNKLSKLPENYMTPQQNRVKDRGSRH